MAFPKAILFVGPPGSGKGTQADEVLSRFDGFVLFDTGREIEKTVNDPKQLEDPAIRMEKEMFEKGELNTSSWVQDLVRDGIKRISMSGQGVILSGSPRTREEAQFLIPLLFEVYGEGSVTVFQLFVSEETSIFRNGHRRICETCGRSIMWSEENKEITFCPVCGGKVITRALDKPEIIKDRLKVYRRRTEAIMPFIRALGISIIEINGEQTPDAVSAQVIGTLNELASH
ncbi:MAG: nucleoside monophosphate kinase [bacterium]|nr:nucleoside monophosphate kinase [bacterium]